LTESDFVEKDQARELLSSRERADLANLREFIVSAMSNLLAANIDTAFTLFGQFGFSDVMEVRRSNLRVLTNVIKSNPPLSGLANYGADDSFDQLADVRIW
jgi:hypothetical protein